MKLSDYLVHRIASEGVKDVFLVPGGAAMHLNDSLGKSADLNFVTNLHEQASAIAAEAYAKVTENLGVAMVTAGPGGTNAVTGVAGAWLDSTPCLFVSGQVKRDDLKRDSGVRQRGVQEIGITDIVGPVTKYAVTITNPDSVRYHFDKAIFLARSGRPGPVWLDLPLDVQAADVDVESLSGFSDPADAAGPPDLTEHVERTLALLKSSRRPALLIGNGVRLAGARTEIRELIDRLQIPVLTTWLALDLIPDSHPLFAGRPGSVAPRGANFTIQTCDLLLAIGARLDNVLCGYSQSNFAKHAKKVVVDIDAAELRKFPWEPDISVNADAMVFITGLLSRLGSGRSSADSRWLEQVKDWKERFPIVLPEHRANAGRVSVYGLSDILSEELTPGDVFVNGSSGSAIEILLHSFRIREGQRFLHTTALGAMGFAVPASIGACIAAGKRRVVVADGDGGFQFNIQELETIRRLNLPIKFFVLNNQGYSSIRGPQRNYFGRLVASDDSSGLTLPDLERISSAWNIPFRRISDASNLREKVRETLRSPGPIICDVNLIPDEDRVPRIYSRIRDDGSMESSPIEDLYPPLRREELASIMSLDKFGFR